MLCSRHEEAWARLLSLCPPNTNVTVSAIYRCHWGRARSPLRSAAPDRRPMHQSRKLHRLFYRASVSSLGSQKSSADLEETGIALIAPAWPTATFGSTTKLFIADHRQYWSQPLVVGDSALVDVADLVKGAVSEINAVIADRKPAVGMVNDGYPLADCRLGFLARRQDEDHFVVLQRQRLREGALLLPGKRVFQIVAAARRPSRGLCWSAPISVDSACNIGQAAAPNAIMGWTMFQPRREQWTRQR